MGMTWSERSRLDTLISDARTEEKQAELFEKFVDALTDARVEFRVKDTHPKEEYESCVVVEEDAMNVWYFTPDKHGIVGYCSIFGACLEDEQPILFTDVDFSQNGDCFRVTLSNRNPAQTLEFDGEYSNGPQNWLDGMEFLSLLPMSVKVVAVRRDGEQTEPIDAGDWVYMWETLNRDICIEKYGWEELDFYKFKIVEYEED